jgi:hypothetical protein
MSAWRRKALELFPEHRQWIQDWIQDKKLIFSIYQLFFDLLPIATEAHENQDERTLERIYQYAEWCWRQLKKAPDIHNAVVVAFYEHLGDDKASLRDIPRWLKPDIFGGVRVLFEARLPADQYTRLLTEYNAVNGTGFS